MKIVFTVIILFFSSTVISAEVDHMYEKARDAFNNHHYNDALIHIKNIIKKSPDHLASHILMAEVLMVNGSPSAAEVQLTKAIDLGADKIKLQELLAESYIQQGKYQQTLDFLPERMNEDNLTSNILALKGSAYLGLRQLKVSQKYFEKSLFFNSNNINAKLGMAQVLINLYKFVEAEKWVDEALTEYLPPIKAWNLKASIHQSLGKYEEALEAVNQSLLTNKNDIQALIYSSSINLEINNYEIAVEHADRVLAQIPNEPKAEFIKAMVNIRKDNTDNTGESISKVAEVLDNLSDDVLRSNPSYYYLASIILFYQKNYVAARQYIDAYLFIDENNIRALTLAAMIEMMQNKYSQARTLLMRANLLEQDNPKILSILGIVYLELNQFDKAHFYFEKVKVLEPDSGIVDMQLAKSYLAKKEPSKAVKYLLSEASSTYDPVVVSLMLVESYMKSGETAKGILVAENLAQTKINDANIQHHLGYIYQLTNDPEKAEIQFKKAISLDSQHAKSIVSMAMIEFNNGDTNNAIKRLKNALKDNPDESQLLITLATIYNRIAKFDEGTALLEEAFALNNKDEDILKNLIVSYVADQRLIFAIETLNTYLLNEKASIDLYLLLAKLHIENKNIKLAANAYKNGLKLGGDKTHIYLLLARAYHDFSNVELAIRTYKKAMAWNVKDERPIIGLSQLYNDEQNAIEAIKLINTFDKSNQLSVILLEILARSHLSIDDYENAEIYFNKCLAKTISEQSIVGLSLVYQSTNRNKKAENILSKNIEQQPKSILLNVALAELYMDKENWLAANIIYEKLLSIYPNQPALLNNASIIALNLNNYVKAQELAEKSLSIVNDHPDSLDTLGWIYYKSGEYKKALPLFRKALALNYTNPEIKYHLALTLKTLNSDKEAIKLMVEVVNSDYSGKVEADILLKKWTK